MFVDVGNRFFVRAASWCAGLPFRRTSHDILLYAKVWDEL